LIVSIPFGRKVIGSIIYRRVIVLGTRTVYSSEGFEIVDIDLEFIRQRRIKAPFLKDRKPKNYQEISSIYIESIGE
jgi:hypothetical protein